VPPPGALTERELGRWRLVADFQARLAQAVADQPLPPTWTDPQRLLSCADYLSLLLFGLLNPVVRTMRGLCTASHVGRVQRDICTRPVSLGSFSAAQAVIDPALLETIFRQLASEGAAVGPAGAGPAGRRWLIQDGSLFDALPRMHWALWRRQYNRPQAQVRLHLTLDLAAATPARATIAPGKHCERAAWRTQWRRGDAYVGDRYYGEDYRMFRDLDAAGIAFVVRLRDEAILTVEEALPLSAADRQAHVQRAAWVRLGSTAHYRSLRLRVVWVQGETEVLRLVTNLDVAELAAGEVALLYKERWRIELFFRWIKCLLGCRHWLAESPQGVAVQLYLALIAALLLHLYTGGRPNRRMLELIQFYLLGVATLDELCAGVERERARLAARKKS
jgi:hypothetical protein